MRASRKKHRLGVAQLLRVLANLTVCNSETQAVFSTTFKTKAVVIRGINDDPDIPGFVIGFLPDKMLKVMDDDGRSHIVPLDRVQEDLGRTIYGRRNQTEFHAEDVEGDQTRSPSTLLAPVSKTGAD